MPVTRTEAAPKALLLRPGLDPRPRRADRQERPTCSRGPFFRSGSPVTALKARLSCGHVHRERDHTHRSQGAARDRGRTLEEHRGQAGHVSRRNPDCGRRGASRRLRGRTDRQVAHLPGTRTPVAPARLWGNQVDLVRGAAAAGVDRLEKAGADEARAVTGFSIGATPPFGHAHEIPALMDGDLLDFDEVWAAGGRPDTVFPVAPALLQAATRALAVDLRQS